MFAIETSGEAGEFKRHFRSDGHWFRDVAYRLHMGLTIYNRLLEPMELSASEEAEFRSRPLVDLAEGYPFPEDLMRKHSRGDSKVPFRIHVSCVCDWLLSGGDYSFLRRLWGHFCASLCDQSPEYKVEWSRPETVVSVNSYFR